MKISRTGEKFRLHLSQRERRLLTDLLRLYPRIPPAHQALSKSCAVPDSKGAQRLLEDALAEQRQRSKTQLQVLLAQTERPGKTAADWHLALSESEMEWLMQVLNDIRVGSWIALGSPEEKMEASVLSEKTAPDYWAMELSGQFQMALLEAVQGLSSSSQS